MSMKVLLSRTRVDERGRCLMLSLQFLRVWDESTWTKLRCILNARDPPIRTK